MVGQMTAVADGSGVLISNDSMGTLQEGSSSSGNSLFQTMMLQMLQNGMKEQITNGQGSTALPNSSLENGIDSMLKSAKLQGFVSSLTFPKTALADQEVEKMDSNQNDDGMPMQNSLTDEFPGLHSMLAMNTQYLAGVSLKSIEFDKSASPTVLTEGVLNTGLLAVNTAEENSMLANDLIMKQNLSSTQQNPLSDQQEAASFLNVVGNNLNLNRMTERNADDVSQNFEVIQRTEVKSSSVGNNLTENLETESVLKEQGVYNVGDNSILAKTGSRSIRDLIFSGMSTNTVTIPEDDLSDLTNAQDSLAGDEVAGLNKNSQNGAHKMTTGDAFQTQMDSLNSTEPGFAEKSNFAFSSQSQNTIQSSSWQNQSRGVDFDNRLFAGSVATDKVEKSIQDDMVLASERANAESTSNEKKSTLPEVSTNKSVEVQSVSNSTLTTDVSATQIKSEQTTSLEPYQQIQDQILNKLDKPGTKEFQMQLKPENLGTIDIKLKLSEGKLIIDIAAESAKTQAFLNGQVDKLVSSLGLQNVKVESVQVGQQTNYDSQNSGNQGSQTGFSMDDSQGRGQQSHRQAQTSGNHQSGIASTEIVFTDNQEKNVEKFGKESFYKLDFMV